MRRIPPRSSSSALPRARAPGRSPTCSRSTKPRVVLMVLVDHPGRLLRGPAPARRTTRACSRFSIGTLAGRRRARWRSISTGSTTSTRGWSGRGAVRFPRGGWRRSRRCCSARGDRGRPRRAWRVGAELLAAAGDGRDVRALRLRLHAAQAADRAVHARRRGARRAAAASPAGRPPATTFVSAPGCSSASCSSGSCRTRWPSRACTATTTRAPACACCRWSTPRAARPSARSSPAASRCWR